MDNIIIGVEAAKLAGLQIDLLQKHRQGNVTSAHLEWFLGLKVTERDALVAGEKLPPKFAAPRKRAEKFELLVDLGIITVPEDHISNPIFCGLHFSNPSRALKPGEQLRVKAYRQRVPYETTSRERMSYLERRAEGNVYVGAQGIELVISQALGKLPRNYWYGSFDKKSNLPEVSVDCYRVPHARVHADGDFSRNCAVFGGSWINSHAFLGFSYIE